MYDDSKSKFAYDMRGDTSFYFNFGCYSYLKIYILSSF